jgi:hypothetical protein
VDITQLTQYLREKFDGTTIIEAAGDTFYIYDPDHDLPPERQMPFVTIVTGDTYDRVSDLSRPGSYRLNIGLPRTTYVTMFGPAPTHRDEDGVLRTGFDYAARDQVMPHPTYASQYWVCVVDPETLGPIEPLLVEAHEFATRKHANYQARRK